MSELCRIMGVNRSGYYKWRDRLGTVNRYESDRITLTDLLQEAHYRHRSYGYHMLAALVRQEAGRLFSDNLVHKCCKHAGIHARIRHYNWRRRKYGEEHKTFKNVVVGRWNTTRPLEIVTSDMTMTRHNGRCFEWTFILDTFNNEIISSHLSGRTGDGRPYFRCLDDLKKQMKEQSEPVILHTDQGSIYSSKAFNDAYKGYNIIHSMSRVGTPTDDPVNESVNGWIKAEMHAEGWQYRYNTAQEMIDAYVEYYNNERPAYSLKYKTPIQYRTELGFG